jgi:D-galactonate transporter
MVAIPHASPQAGPDFERRVYRRVTRRLIPFLFLCYIFAYIDRVNVGFAKLQMQQDLNISDAVYGAAAGIFFIGYFFFEVPCNLALQKIGARRWLGPIMIVWGFVSACTMFVHTAHEFYLVRFILGIVESGFFPGVILYLTFWYTRKHRAKMVASFMTAIPLSGVLGGPLSGWILHRFSTAGGLRGWQWLYLVEAVPSILAGLATLLFLEDHPQKAKWLNSEERALLLDSLEQEEQLKRQDGSHHHSLLDAFRSSRVWILCLVYFGTVSGNYAIQFWLPQIVKDTLTKDPFRIGLLTMIPWGLAAITMVLVGHHSDATGERRWHVSLAALSGGCGLAISAIPGIPGVLGFMALTLAAASIVSASSTFWSLPTSYLSGAAASAGIAWINSVGNLGGFVGPFLVGKIRDLTHSTSIALFCVAGSCLMSCILVATIFRQRFAAAK